jgi:hypothetical protein
MSTSPNRRKVNLIGVVFAAGLALPTGMGFALAAEQPSAEEIIKALKPPRITRGLTTSPADTARAAEETRFVDSLRNRTTVRLQPRSARRSHRSPSRSRASISRSPSSTTRPPSGRRRCRRSRLLATPLRAPT